MRGRDTNTPDAELLGLQALAWTLGEQARADRLIATTGLYPDDLRARAGASRSSTRPPSPVNEERTASHPRGGAVAALATDGGALRWTAELGAELTARPAAREQAALIPA